MIVMMMMIWFVFNITQESTNKGNELTSKGKKTCVKEVWRRHQEKKNKICIEE